MKTKYCPNCKTATAHSDESASHIVHGVLTFFTGLWALVWIAMHVKANKNDNICQQCGCQNN